MMRYGISVIVPFKDAQETIQKCMASIAKQKFKNFEVILVADNSTDNSMQIVKKFIENNNRFILIENKGVTHGVSTARNLGIKHATQDYVTFIDSDDYVEKNFLTNLVNMLNQNSDSNQVFPISGVSNELKEAMSEVKNFGQTDTILQFNRKNAILQLLRNDSFEGYVFNKLFKMSLIKKNNLMFNSSISFSEDLLFCFQYMINLDENTKVCYSLQKTYHYVNNPQSVMNSSRIGGAFDKREFSLVKAFDEMLGIAKYYGVEPVILQSLKVRKVWACSLILRKLHYFKFFEHKIWFEYKQGAEVVQKYIFQNVWLFLRSSMYGLKDKLILSIDLIFPRLFVKLWKKQHRGA